MATTRTRGTGTPLVGLIVGVAMTALTLTACGLFDIRDPIAPIDTEPDPCAGQIPAISDDVVLDNFALAMKCGTGGLGLYEDTLGDSFALELDPLDAGDFGGRDTLSRAENIQAHETIANIMADSLRTEVPGDSVFFAFTLVEPTRTDASAFYEDMPYILELVSQQEATPVVIQTYSGTVDLTVVEADDASWVLQRWKDQGDQGGNPTLGAFHATFALEQTAAGGRRIVVD